MEKEYNRIIKFLQEYQKQNQVFGYVLGISGGKDSTIVAKLLCDAIGKSNVIGVLMPNGLQHDLKDAHTVCDILDIKRMEINIDDLYNYIISMCSSTIFSADHSSGYSKLIPLEGLQISYKAEINITPRIRMTILYSIAQSMGYLVAGTGNASERFIGWFTKWGDGACDINPIAHLTCTEVIELGDYLKLPKELIYKTPSDGLTGKSDEANFGFKYSELDALIKKQELLNNTGKLPSPYTELEKRILEINAKTKHKFAPKIIS